MWTSSRFTFKNLSKFSPNPTSNNWLLAIQTSIIWNFFNGRLFFFGTNEKKMPGSLRVSKYPFSGEEILDLQSHAKGIKKIKITFDDSYIFTVGEDGLLIIFEIKDKVSWC